MFCPLLLVSTATSGTAFPPSPTPAEAVMADSVGRLEDERPGTGYVPPQTDLSHLQASWTKGMPVTPSCFDWRKAGKVSPVKNQDVCGSCYAFATIANLESRLLIQGDSLFDLSENNLKECGWFEAGCGGGNDWMAASLLTTAGAVLETCDPYIPVDVECKISCPYPKLLLDWRVISGGTPAPVDVIKHYIMEYGPVYSTLDVGDGGTWRAEFNGYDGSYVLYRETYDTPNHAVLIVGWDDDLPHAGGTGAWIVKNSWGTSWGGPCGFGPERGYFTIAYGSAGIGANSSFAADVGAWNPADTLLYYDEAGFGGSIGIMNQQTAWGLCKYIPSRSIEVKRVEFWTPDATVDVDCYVYDEFHDGSPWGLLAVVPDNAFDLAGYHSVDLPHPLPVAAGEDVYVVIKFTTAVSKFPLAYDSSGPRTSGCCYMSSDGTCFKEFTYGDLGIRLRASKGIRCSDVGDTPVITEISDVPGDSGGYVSLTWTRNAGDSGESGETKFYRVWRECREMPNPTLQSGVFAAPGATTPYRHGVEGPAREVVATVRATGRCCYQVVAPTHCDQRQADTCWTYFSVSAHTGVWGEHYDSPLARGYSVDNTSTLTKPGSEPAILPEPESQSAGTELRPAVPNPSRTGFEVGFSLPRPDWVQAYVYDVHGREVDMILDQVIGAGSHSITWKPRTHAAAAIPPGTYFLRLVTSSETHTSKLVLIE